MTATIVALTTLYQSLCAASAVALDIRRALAAPGDGGLDRALYEIAFDVNRDVIALIIRIQDALAERDAPVAGDERDDEDQNVDVCTACGALTPATTAPEPADDSEPDCEPPEFDVEVIGATPSQLRPGQWDVEVAIRVNRCEFATGEVTRPIGPVPVDASAWIDGPMLNAIDERISRSYRHEREAEALAAVVAKIEVVTGAYLAPWTVGPGRELRFKGEAVAYLARASQDSPPALSPREADAFAHTIVAALNAARAVFA